MQNTADILGINILRSSVKNTVQLFDDALSIGNQLCIAYANAHSLNIAFENKEYHSVLQSFLVLNDGIGVSLASRLLYRVDFEDNLNGTDFTPLFLRSSQHEARLFLLGGKPGVAERAATILSGTSGSITIAGCLDGYFDRSKNDDIVNIINESNANVLLIAFGNPLQEFWIHRNRDALKPTLLIGVGALFDFLSGDIRRAPRWMQLTKTEWIYRLYLEPKRMWRRYVIGNPLFLYRAIKQAIASSQ